MPVASYSPELLQIFKLGSQKPFRFDCKTNKRAHAFRWRLHSLRRAMREEDHWLLPVAESVVISIEPDAKTGTIICAHPPDETIISDLQKALEEQGAELIENEPEKETLEEPEEYKDLPSTSTSTSTKTKQKSNLSENAIESFLKKGN